MWIWAAVLSQVCCADNICKDSTSMLATAQTCLGHLQILVLGFCDNQRDEELIWKILSQVQAAVFSVLNASDYYD